MLFQIHPELSEALIYYFNAEWLSELNLHDAQFALDLTYAFNASTKDRRVHLMIHLTHGSPGRYLNIQPNGQSLFLHWAVRQKGAPGMIWYLFIIVISTQRIMTGYCHRTHRFRTLCLFCMITLQMYCKMYQATINNATTVQPPYQLITPSRNFLAITQCIGHARLASFFPLCLILIVEGLLLVKSRVHFA